MLQVKNSFYLPSGRVFLTQTKDGYNIECTEMRDVAVGGKEHFEVRTATDPQVIWKHLVPFEKKWLLTVSTQKGCPHNCQFCDVAPLPFRGNLTQKEIEQQVALLLLNTPYVKQSEKVKIGFARMGEPAHNLDNVLGAMGNLSLISSEYGRGFRWLPCFNTILPRNCKFSPEEVLRRVTETKEKQHNGFLHLQLSCNSTDEAKRKELFGGADVFTLPEIITEVNKYEITKRTVTLNFIVMEGVEVDPHKLKAMGADSDKFMIKLIPLNRTFNGEGNDLKTVANYNNYDKLLDLKKKFESAGLPVVIDAIAKCEEAGLCCGQLAQTFQS